MWSARRGSTPRRAGGWNPRTNDIDLDERRKTIAARPGGGKRIAPGRGLDKHRGTDFVGRVPLPRHHLSASKFQADSRPWSAAAGRRSRAVPTDSPPPPPAGAVPVPEPVRRAINREPGAEEGMGGIREQQRHAALPPAAAFHRRTQTVILVIISAHADAPTRCQPDPPGRFNHPNRNPREE